MYMYIIKKWYEYGLDNVFIKGAMIHNYGQNSHCHCHSHILALASRISHLTFTHTVLVLTHTV